jgi:hypothetical protein
MDMQCIVGVDLSFLSLFFKKNIERYKNSNTQKTYIKKKELGK